MYGKSSANPAHWVKIGPVDIKIIGLTEITKEHTHTRLTALCPRLPG